MNLLRITLIVLTVLVCMAGCHCGNDRLLIHAEDAATGMPLANAKLNIGPLFSSTLPPRWRSVIDTNGNATLKVNLPSEDMISLRIRHNDMEYGFPFSRGEFDANNSLVEVRGPSGTPGPTISVTVTLLPNE